MNQLDRPLIPADFKVLQRLEEDLWREETRYDRKLMNEIFAEDFFEFGRSGRTYEREEMLPESGMSNTIEATLPLPKFRARLLSDDVAHLTYISELVVNGKLQRANRSSIWSRTTEGWRLRFHQGTPV